MQTKQSINDFANVLMALVQQVNEGERRRRMIGEIEKARSGAYVSDPYYQPPVTGGHLQSAQSKTAFATPEMGKPPVKVRTGMPADLTPPSFDDISPFIMQRESGGNPRAVNINKTGKYAGSQDTGLYQINDMHLQDDGSDFAKQKELLFQEYGLPANASVEEKRKALMDNPELNKEMARYIYEVQGIGGYATGKDALNDYYKSKGMGEMSIPHPMSGADVNRDPSITEKLRMMNTPSESSGYFDVSNLERAASVNPRNREGAVVAGNPPQIFSRGKYAQSLAMLPDNDLAQKQLGNMVATAPKNVNLGGNLVQVDPITGDILGVVKAGKKTTGAGTMQYSELDSNGMPVPHYGQEGGVWFKTVRVDNDGNVMPNSEGWQNAVKPATSDIERPEQYGNLTGEAFLKAMEKNPVQRRRARIIRGLATYQLEYSSKYFSSRSGLKTEYAGDVLRANPAFSDAWYKAYDKLARDATTGSIARGARSINTAIGHLKQWKDAADDLQNTAFRLGNKFENWLKDNLGDPRVSNFMMSANAIGSELAASLKGGTGQGAAPTDPEIESWRKSFDISMSQGQLDVAFRSALELLGSRIGALEYQVHNTSLPKEIQDRMAGFSILSPPARQILESYGFDINKYIKGAIDPDPNKEDETIWGGG